MTSVHVPFACCVQVSEQCLLHGRSIAEQECTTNSAGQRQINVRRTNENVCWKIEDVATINVPPHKNIPISPNAQLDPRMPRERYAKHQPNPPSA